MDSNTQDKNPGFLTAQVKPDILTFLANVRLAIWQFVSVEIDLRLGSGLRFCDLRVTL